MNNDNNRAIVYIVFASAISTAVLISAKITTLLGFTFTVGAYVYAITFPCTDIIAEVYGKQEARRLVMFGFIGYVVAVTFSFLAVESTPASFWIVNQDAYSTVFGVVPRIVIASVCAYFISQLHDIWAFHYWKHITKERYLWVRNNFSTITSQLIDSILFVVIAFYGIVPDNALVGMIMGQYIVKVCIAIIDTPFVYIGVSWLRRSQE